MLAGEYVNFDTIITKVTTNKDGVPMATKVSVFGSNADMPATSVRRFRLGLHTQLQSY